MRQTIDSTFEYDRGPVLWGAAVVFVLGLAVNFVLFRPLWLVFAAFLGGAVAAMRCGFYDASANNGAVAAILGSVALLPALAVTRTAWYDLGGSGDTLFISAVLVLSWLPILVIVLAPIGYVGAVVVDFLRRRVDAPIGY